MFKYFRALWYMVTGRFSAAAEALQGNQYVMAATYDASIEKSEERYHTVRNAVAKLVGIEQDRVEKIKTLSEKCERLEKVKAGAAGKAKALAEKLKGEGKSAAEIKQHPEYLKHMGAFQNAATSLTEAEGDIEELEVELEGHRKNIAQYKVQLQNMQRSAKDLKEEKQEAIADVAIAKEMQAVNDVLSGVAEDTVDKDLQAARQARKDAKAKAKITAELAGNDAALAEDEYVNFASSNDASSEFDDLIGLTDNDASDFDPAKLPE